MLTMLARQVREHVQPGFQAVERLGLQDRVGHLGEVVDVVGEHPAVLVEELRVRGQQLVEVAAARSPPPGRCW